MRKRTHSLYAWWWASALLLAPLLMQAQPSDTQKAATATGIAIEQNFGQQQPAGKKPATAYPPALRQLEAMLAGKQPYSFKKAVFITENAFFDDGLSYEKFCAKIELLTHLCRYFKEHHQLLYDFLKIGKTSLPAVPSLK